MDGRALVWHKDGEAELHLHFIWKGEPVRMQREIGGALDGTFVRLAKKLENKKTGEAAPAICLIRRIDGSLDDDGAAGGAAGDCVVPTTEPNSAFKTAHFLALGDQHLEIVVNPPVVRNIRMPAYPMVNCALVPSVDLEHAELSACRFAWFRVRPKDKHGGHQVSDALMYTPTHEDLGFDLEFEVLPVNAAGSAGLPMRERIGCDVKAKDSKNRDLKKLSPWTVTEHHLHPRIQERLRIAEAKGRDTIRVCTYNILYDGCCNSDWSLQNIYPYLDPNFATYHYRVQMIMREVLGYSSDIVCMQEVGKNVFDDYLVPRLGAIGFSGVYANKITSARWGQSTFVNTTRFDILSSEALDLTQVWKEYPDFLRMCEVDPSVKRKLERTCTVAQLLQLQEKDRSAVPFCVVNCHLFSNPYAAHFRTMQAFIILDQVERRFGKDTPLVFVGDFNATPDSGACSFLVSGSFPSTHFEFAEGTLFGDIAQETKEEREENWHLVLGDSDVRFLRELFCHLDPEGTARVSKMVLARLVEEHMGTTADAIHWRSDAAVESCTYAEHFFTLANLRLRDQEKFYAWMEAFYHSRPDHGKSAERRVPACPEDCATLYPALNLAHSFALASAVPEVPFSYFAGGTQPTPRVLDYMYFTKTHFAASTPFEPFTALEARADGALPSAQIPSDHVALVADFVQVKSSGLML